VLSDADKKAKYDRFGHGSTEMKEAARNAQFQKAYDQYVGFLNKLRAEGGLGMELQEAKSFAEYQMMFRSPLELAAYGETYQEMYAFAFLPLEKGGIGLTNVDQGHQITKQLVNSSSRERRLRPFSELRDHFLAMRDFARREVSDRGLGYPLEEANAKAIELMSDERIRAATQKVADLRNWTAERSERLARALKTAVDGGLEMDLHEAREVALSDPLWARFNPKSFDQAMKQRPPGLTSGEHKEYVRAAFSIQDPELLKEAKFDEIAAILLRGEEFKGVLAGRVKAFVESPLFDQWLKQHYSKELISKLTPLFEIGYVPSPAIQADAWEHFQVLWNQHDGKALGFAEKLVSFPLPKDAATLKALRRSIEMAANAGFGFSHSKADQAAFEEVRKMLKRHPEFAFWVTDAEQARMFLTSSMFQPSGSTLTQLRAALPPEAQKELLNNLLINFVNRRGEIKPEWLETAVTSFAGSEYSPDFFSHPLIRNWVTDDLKKPAAERTLSKTELFRNYSLTDEQLETWLASSKKLRKDLYLQQVLKKSWSDPAYHAASYAYDQEIRWIRKVGPQDSKKASRVLLQLLESEEELANLQGVSPGFGPLLDATERFELQADEFIPFFTKRLKGGDVPLDMLGHKAFTRNLLKSAAPKSRFHQLVSGHLYRIGEAANGTSPTLIEAMLSHPELKEPFLRGWLQRAKNQYFSLPPEGFHEWMKDQQRSLGPLVEGKYSLSDPQINPLATSLDDLVNDFSRHHLEYRWNRIKGQESLPKFERLEQELKEKLGRISNLGPDPEWADGPETALHSRRFSALSKG
jgi:hypothetical protein